jgi:hypothetical protein
MAQRKDIDKSNVEKHIDKPKGEVSVREAASLEMPLQGSEPHRVEIPMQGGPSGAGQRNVGESVTEIVDRIFQLPFRAQLGVLRAIGPRILGALDARDRDTVLREMIQEFARVESGEQSPPPPGEG